MARVTWSDRALTDLAGIRDFIARDSPMAASALVTRIVHAVERLEDFPLMGRVVPEHGNPDLRELIVGRYRVVYRLIARKTEIARVQHGAMPLDSDLT